MSAAAAIPIGTALLVASAVASAKPPPPPSPPPAASPAAPAAEPSAPAAQPPPVGAAPPAAAPPAASPPPSGDARAYPPPPYGGYPPPLPALPPTRAYKEGGEIPDGYHLVSKSDKTAIAIGMSLFGLAYGMSLVGGSIMSLSGGSRSEQYIPLLIPVIGPFVTMGTVERHPPMATMTLDGITQVTGLIVTIVGAVNKDHVLVRNDLGDGASLKPNVYVGPRSVALEWRF